MERQPGHPHPVTIFPNDPDRDFGTSERMRVVEVLIFGAKNHYRDICDTAAAMSNSKGEQSEVVGVVLQVMIMDFVSTVERLAKVASVLPGGGALREPRKLFRRRAGLTSEARNHFEHLDQRIEQALQHGMPALGAPSWAENRDDGTVALSFHIPGRAQKGSTSAPLTFARVPTTTGVGGVMIRIGAEDYDLEAAYEAVVELEQSLRRCVGTGEDPSQEHHNRYDV